MLSYTEEELLGYDADFSDPRQYCKHGTFIGSWWGPDYLCGYCEMGVSVCDQCGAFGHPSEELSYLSEKRYRKFVRNDVRWHKRSGQMLCHDCLVKQKRLTIWQAMRWLDRRQKEVRHG
jgi:hypothetical protein